MKKMLCLILALVMALSLAVPAMATEPTWTDSRNSTQVEYDASQESGATTENFTITVPAKMAPNSSSTVTATGNWAANRKLTVTADTTVSLTSTTGGSVSLTVSLQTMEITGDDNAAIDVSKTVTVGDWNSVTSTFTKPLFGKWTGTFDYTAVMGDVA